MSRTPDKGPKILLVEDEDLLREGFQDFLESEGMTVVAARNGSDALQALRRTKDVSLVLLDLQMPVMNGLQFRIAQLADETIAEVPVVALTGGIDLDTEVRRLGLRALLRKPVRLERLLAAIHDAALPAPESAAPLAAAGPSSAGGRAPR